MHTYLKEGKYSYQQTDKIGEGSFAKVYRGYNHQSKTWIALKQIDISKLHKQDDQLKKIILSEITVMKKFRKNMQKQKCIFVVSNEDCFRTQTYIYIVMQLCSGGTLEQQMQQKQYNENQCRYIVSCIANGLSYMNRMGIVHRDLKPQNIFLATQPNTNKKVYKIGDFGFATHKQELDLAMGTVPYMAPQMFIKKQYTNKIDVWSLGIISFEIFYKELYFKGKDVWEIKNNIKEQQFIFTEAQKKSISVDYQNFIQLCLIKSQQFRISPENLLKHPFINDLTPLSSMPTKNTQLIQNAQKLSQTEKQTSKMSSFDKLYILISQTIKLREMAEQFAIFHTETKRITEFIQLYLLKDAYVMMNRITYTLLYRQDHIGMNPEQFNELLIKDNEDKYNQLSDYSQKQCLYISGLFNEKYKYFTSCYLEKFSDNDKQLIKKTINQQPYEYTNEKVMQKQIQKWSIALKKYPKFSQLQQNCRRVYELKVTSQ